MSCTIPARGLAPAVLTRKQTGNRSRQCTIAIRSSMRQAGQTRSSLGPNIRKTRWEGARSQQLGLRRGHRPLTSTEEVELGGKCPDVALQNPRAFCHLEKVTKGGGGRVLAKFQRLSSENSHPHHPKEPPSLRVDQQMVRFFSCRLGYPQEPGSAACHCQLVSGGNKQGRAQCGQGTGHGTGRCRFKKHAGSLRGEARFIDPEPAGIRNRVDSPAGGRGYRVPGGPRRHASERHRPREGWTGTEQYLGKGDTRADAVPVPGPAAGR